MNIIYIIINHLPVYSRFTVFTVVSFINSEKWLLVYSRFTVKGVDCKPGKYCYSVGYSAMFTVFTVFTVFWMYMYAHARARGTIKNIM